ncbi:MAG TPA: hypothetical protein PLQ93_04875 [Bacteroidia bacterium]|nr:hypothetical protein [Bacteroidia bacterium]
MNLKALWHIAWLFCLLHTGTGKVLAQNNFKLNSMAQLAMKDKNWDAAEHQYAKLYNRDSSNVKVSYAYADAARQNMNVEKALYLYQKVLKANAGRYPLAVFWTGQLYKYKMNYREASKWFVKFSKLKLNSGLDYYKQKALREVEACELASMGLNNPLHVNVIRLDSGINTYFSEFAPRQSGKQMYFSSLRNPRRNESDQVFSKIYVRESDNPKRLRAYSLDTAVNSTYLHNANATLDETQRHMVFSRCSNVNASDYQCALYQSFYVNNKWTQAVRLNDSVNRKNYSSTHPALAFLNGRKVLFFSSNQPGGSGGMDIWYAEAKSDGTFKGVRNAGRRVNSSEDEITPFFNSKSSELYFSSNYFNGYGAFDIFRSQFGDSGFAAPVNMAYPVNSGYNDLYYSVDTAANQAFFASNRPGSNNEKRGSCCNDIYAFPLETKPVENKSQPDSVRLTKEKIRLLVPLTLYFHNDEPDPKTENTQTEQSYLDTYTAYRELYQRYLFEFTRGYKGEEKAMATQKVESFFSDSLESGFENLEKFCDLMALVLQKGQKVQITLKGYCSPLASTTYNQKLARRRISSLRNYFMRTRNGYFKTFTEERDGHGPLLLFAEEDIGELPGSKASDDFKDKRNSVYSPYAASERKIQIIAVSFD